MVSVMNDKLLSNDSSFPFISVIVPVYNDPSGLADTLESLARQDYPSTRWQVIVVDNNSTDNTLTVSTRFDKRLPDLTTLVEKSRQSSYAARNRGIEQAKGQIMAFIDADMTVGPEWLRRGAADILEGRGDYIGCPVDVYAAHSPPTIWERRNMRGAFPIQMYMEEQGFAGAGNLFVHRRVIESVGMFDERLISSGDMEFGNRVRDAGFTLYYSRDNVMRHPARSSLRSTWNKHFRVGKGHADLRHLFPERYGPLTLRSVIGRFYRLFRAGPPRAGAGPAARQTLGVRFAARIPRLGRACGYLARYVEIRTHSVGV